MGGATSICMPRPRSTAQMSKQDADCEEQVGISATLSDDSRPKAIHIDDCHSEPDILVTPRREKALFSSVVQTPKGEAAHIYKYFCPICTMYFEDILRSQCCGNYSCISCTTSYVGVKGCQVGSVSDVLRIVEPTLLCLSCNTPGFQPRLVQHEDIIRDYSRNTCDASFNGSSPGSIPYSPVKIGDSYENLKRKMQPFPDVRQHLLFVDEISKDDSSCGITEASVHGGNVDNVVSAHVSESAADESIPLATNLHNNDNTPDKNSPARTSDINQTDYSISVALSISKELQSPGQIAVEQNHGAVFVQQ